MPKEKFYITTSIPYLNARPHLGHALEAVQTDVVARYKRLEGYDTFFLSGADEHGAKIAKAAEAQNKNPKEFVDEMLLKFKELLEKIEITNDDFIRTSDQERHWPGAQLLWKKLSEAGDIYKGFYKGFYCEGCEAFITEKDMENGLCAIHKKPPETVEEENYFFKLSKYTSRIEDALKKDEVRILPEFRKVETLNMLKEIGDISFSRPSKDISWGVPVPGDATQTMYVWCDALSNYITALGFGLDDDIKFKKYWPADTHVIGKDIMKFHTVFWLAMLMSAGLPLPKTIFIHGWIHIRGEKMSKSIGNVVDPLPLTEKYGADAVRFFLTHEISTFADGDYFDDRFAEIYEGLLVNGLGNLVSRTLKMISGAGILSKPEDARLACYPVKKNLDFLIAEKSKMSFEEATPSFLIDVFLWAKYRELMEKGDISAAIKAVWVYMSRLDEYVEEYKPYNMLTTDANEAKVVLWHLAYSLVSIAWMIKPFLPDTADKILAAFGVNSASQAEWKEFSVKEIPHLFPRIK